MVDGVFVRVEEVVFFNCFLLFISKNFVLVVYLDFCLSICWDVLEFVVWYYLILLFIFGGFILRFFVGGCLGRFSGL